MGAVAGSLADLLGVCHELKDTMCSIFGAPDMCSMIAIEHIVWVALLDE